MRNRGRIAGWALALLVLANGASSSACGGRGRRCRTSTTPRACSSALGRISGLLGAYLVLVQLLLLARLPVLERLVGFDRLTRWHRAATARGCSLLLVRTPCSITAGYAIGDRLSLPDEIGRLI